MLNRPQTEAPGTKTPATRTVTDLLDRFWGLRPGQILGIALVTIVVGVLIYVVYFGLLLGQPLSDTTAEWANFGTYLQGVAGSLLAFLGMWLVAHSLRASIRDINTTLLLGQQQLEETRRQIEDQRTTTLLTLLDRLERTLLPIQDALENALAKETVTPYGFLSIPHAGQKTITVRQVLQEVRKHARAVTQGFNLVRVDTVLSKHQAADIERALLSLDPRILKRLVRLCNRYGQRTDLYDVVEGKLKGQLSGWLETGSEYIGLRDPDELRTEVKTLGQILGLLPSRPSGQFIGSTAGLRHRYGDVVIEG
jgi:hypothetical protein